MLVEELFDILLSDKPSDIIRTREEEVFCLIPELSVCKGFDQHNEWHIYDVYEHILHVIDNVPKNIVLRLTALFHDVGKPISYTEDEDGVGHFYGHWEESEKIFKKYADKYHLDKDLKNTVSNLIYFHDINIDKLNNLELKKIYGVLGTEGIKMLYQLKKADLLAQNSKFSYLLEEYTKQEDRLISQYKRK